MKYVLLLGAIAVVYYFLSRSAPIAPVAQAVTGQEAAELSVRARPVSAPASSAVAAPLARTKATLGQVERRNGDGEF